jgi:thioredoxin-related protein
MSAAIIHMMEQIKLAAYGGDINGWVCEKVFIERSGITSVSARCRYRLSHPELVRVNDQGKYIYNLPGYFKTFKQVGD